MTTEERNDLDWLAFRYIADELADAERAEFEQQLVDSQPAREAVAGAVELTEAIAVAGAVEELVVASATVAGRAQRTGWLRRVAWVATGAVACLALVFVCQGFVIGPMASLQTDESSESGVSKRKPISPDLAIAWSQTRTDLAIASDGSWSWPLADETPDVADDFPVAVVPAEGVSPVAAPDWMMAAVSGMMSKSNADLDE
jgi:hypothetical protein